MADKQVTQVDLSWQMSEDQVRHMTTWLDADKRIKEGVVLSLKGVQGRWVVDKVYDTRDLADVDKRGWDNNDYGKHTGLNFTDPSND